MERVFFEVLNMSFTAGVVVLFVLAARLLLRRAPRVYSYALWSVVLFRLVCPLSFESMLSLLPVNPTPVSPKILYAAVPRVDTGVAALDDAVSAVLPAATPMNSVNPMQILVWLGDLVWCVGAAALLLYSLFALWRLHGRLRGAEHLRDNIWCSDRVDTAFVLGVFRPQIYLPAGLSQQETEYILLHEQTHIRRFDHVVKLVSFLALCVHWFNPLVWTAFFLSGSDMEMACDEAVVSRMGSGVKGDYSTSLLALATGRRVVGGTPLAFGEGDTKGRVKHVLSYRKPGFWVAGAALALVAALAVGLAANRAENRHFPMSGAGLGDLNPATIMENIERITGQEREDIMVFSDIHLRISEDFEWLDPEAISFLYPQETGGKDDFHSARLRVYNHEMDFFVTQPNEASLQVQTYPMELLLEALKYLPQEEIRALVRGEPGRYIVQLVDAERSVNPDRQLYYGKNGVLDQPGAWHIRLEVSPMYSVGNSDTSFRGDGAHVIYVFYCGEGEGAVTAWSEYPTTFELYSDAGLLLRSSRYLTAATATELPALLLKGTDETEPSVNDTPQNAAEYLKITMGVDTNKVYFVYETEGTFCVEVPYDYRRELEEDTYRALMAYLEG